MTRRMFGGEGMDRLASFVLNPVCMRAAGTEGDVWFVVWIILSLGSVALGGRHRIVI